jgi:[protein-PII] uridylyltransferase
MAATEQIPNGVAAGREALRVLWDRGLGGRELLKEQTALIDALVSKAFADCPEPHAKIALVATGGYGRGELFPFSDIDVMLLYDPEVEETIPAVTKSVFYPLWDAGLEVGHGVRTVNACLEDCSKDFFFQIALLDARLICGDASLFSRLQEEFKASVLIGRRKALVEDMIAHRRERHRRFGEHAYLLEPNIKESRGGLRDVQAVLWTAKVLFGLEGIEAIYEAGLLDKDEKIAFQQAWETLIKIRNRLHYVSGRKNDRLFFEYQEGIANALGYPDSDGMLGVEHFMREVYGHLQTNAITSDLFFEHAEEVLQPSRSAEMDKNLEPGVDLLNGKIHLSDPSLLTKRPYLLMRLFAQSAKTGLPLHHRTRRAIANNLRLVNEGLRRSKRMSGAFIDVLSDAKKPLDALEVMLNTGLLPAYIPEFDNVKYMALHDVYHVNTVDRHLLQTVAELHKIREENAVLFGSIRSPRVLFLSALLHDIGKGQGKSHSVIGARLVSGIGKRLGLSREETDGLCCLVENHVFLVDTAMRRDLDDEAFVLKCARRIGDLDRLKMLYLLSMADSRATGPNVWNDWKAALLQELYLKIAHVFDQADLSGSERSQAIGWMKQQIEARIGPTASAILPILPEDYILSFTPEAVERHLKLKEELSSKTVLVLPEDKGSFWSLLVIARDRTGLLSRICGVLDLHDLKVLAAQIFTLEDRTVVDTLDVKSTVGRDHEEQDWDGLRKDLTLALDDKLGLTYRLAQKYAPLTWGTHQVCRKPVARVVIDNNTSDFYTIIEVYANDRIGLLYDVTATLSDFRINIFRAKIGTRSDQIVNVFYVLDRADKKIDEPAIQEELRNALLYVAGCET